MADSGLVKWVKEEENNQLGHLLQQYKYDVKKENGTDTLMSFCTNLRIYAAKNFHQLMELMEVKE